MTLEGQAFFHFSFLVKKFVAFVLALLGFNFNCKSISPSMRALDSLHWCGTFFTTPVSVRIRQVNACFLGWEDTNYNAKYPIKNTESEQLISFEFLFTYFLRLHLLQHKGRTTKFFLVYWVLNNVGSFTEGRDESCPKGPGSQK